MAESSSPDIELQKQLSYYKKQLDQMSGESIQHDFVLSSLRHELKQKKEGLSILTNLQREFSVTLPLPIVFAITVKAINIHLGMDHSIVLLPASSPDTFKASHWYGFREEQILMQETGEVTIPTAYCKTGQYILLNKTTCPDETGRQIQKIYTVNYFIGVPILLDEKPIAFIISGRQFEKVPFIPPLNKGDADTLMAIAGLISTVCQDKNMIELKLQKAEVEKQKESISVQRDNLEQTLKELRTAQAMLVQREKMASLGELTAGIAHEIQNPLNFVNNFSDVSTELVDEMNTEIDKGNLEDAKQIAQDLKQNLEKILHHGKRAGDIVKGMLQHSRSSSGIKEPTNINTLADEFLRLAYHGLRAKDKSFNATMKTDYDESVGNIHIIPQDIGRVMLNLINNAFYAVTERKRQQQEGYEPTVSISTKKMGDKVLISVKDNGNGIPPKVLDKIFQPFFTTKPTGQGTGLGLSLAYDIIKAHGGELKVETKEGEGAEFIISLPLI